MAATNGTDPAFRTASTDRLPRTSPRWPRGRTTSRRWSPSRTPVRGVEGPVQPALPGVDEHRPGGVQHRLAEHDPGHRRTVPAGHDRPHREDGHAAPRPDSWWGTPAKLDRDHLPGLDRPRGPTRWPTTRSTSTRSAPASTCSAARRATPGVAIRQAPGAVLQPHHVQRRTRRDPVRPAAAPGHREGHRPGGHRPAADRPDRARRPPGRATTSTRRHQGLPGQLRRAALRPRGRRPRAGRAGLALRAPGRSGAGEGRQAADRCGWCSRRRQPDLRTDRPPVPNQLAQIGVDGGDRDGAGARSSSTERTRPATSTWSGSPGAAPPPRSAPPVGLYAEPTGNDVQQNYGRIYDPEINALFEPGPRASWTTPSAPSSATGSTRLIWQQVHHLPLYPDTGAYAVRVDAGQLRRARLRRHRLHRSRIHRDRLTDPGRHRRRPPGPFRQPKPAEPASPAEARQNPQ